MGYHTVHSSLDLGRTGYVLYHRLNSYGQKRNYNSTTAFFSLLKAHVLPLTSLCGHQLNYKNGLNTPAHHLPLTENSRSTYVSFENNNKIILNTNKIRLL